MEQRLAALTPDQAAGTVRLCFGSKKLFRAQLDLTANGYADHAAWRRDRQSARSNEFFVIGSKDETGRRDSKGWRIFASTEVEAPPRRRHRLAGALGVDVNADHLAVAELERFGNCLQVRRIGCDPRGRSQDQRDALIGDAVKRIADWAMAVANPVFIERLDFASKKAELERSGAADARSVSARAYAKTGEMLKAACFRRGIEVAEVDPTYTSVIGAVNHARARGVGVSVHQGAAIAIARQGLGLSERPTVRYGIAPARNGGHVTFALPARNRAKHVWSFWSKVRTQLRAAHVAHFRSGRHRLPPAPLPPGESPPALGATWISPARLRRANRQQCCSADVLADVPF